MKKSRAKENSAKKTIDPTPEKPQGEETVAKAVEEADRESLNFSDDGNFDQHMIESDISLPKGNNFG